MATQTYYGSAVADASLTTACLMATAAGGTETSKSSTFGGSGNFAEVLSQGGSPSGVSSIPSTPTGNGWISPAPGAGSFATGNFSFLLTISEMHGTTPVYTVRAFKYSSGTYSSLGTQTVNESSSSKTTYTLLIAVVNPNFLSTDRLYFDCWFNDPTGVNGDIVTVYESTSSSNGVANDIQVTTTNFTASGGTTHQTVSDGLGGLFQ
jgi:hypothetical protein